MALVKLCKTDEVKSGRPKTVSIKGNEIAVFNVNGSFYATSNVCPHEGGPLGEGFMEGKCVVCPLHGWKFDVTTGKSPDMAAKVITFKTSVKGNELFVDMP